MAILPDATEIDQLPLYGKTRTIEEYAVDESWHESENPSEPGCVYVFRLPGEDSAISSVWIELTEIADPDLVERYHDQANSSGMAAYQDIDGVDDCYLRNLYDTQLICRRGPVRFILGGRTSAVFEEHGHAFSYWRDEVLPLFATNAGRKIRPEVAPAADAR